MRYTFQPYAKTPLVRGHLNLGGANPQGGRIDVNNLYLERDGKPWVPIMGEFHFSRGSRPHWYRELCKMKAGGVTVVATTCSGFTTRRRKAGSTSPATGTSAPFCWRASGRAWRR